MIGLDTYTKADVAQCGVPYREDEKCKISLSSSVLLVQCCSFSVIF